MSTRCARLFEVEALRDGRLAGPERVHFERHLATCAACSKEAKALDDLGAALRSGASVDELHVRRERTRLLAAFDGVLTARATPRRRSGLALVAVAIGVLCATILLFLRFARDPDSLAVARVSVRGETGAVWSRRTEGERELIVLERGELRIEVRNDSTKPALLVLLPDGDLVDEGTIFSVRVEAGRTTRVAVDEGKVSLRIRGRAAHAIGPNESWEESVLPPQPRAQTSAPTLQPSSREPKATIIEAPAAATATFPARAPAPSADAPSKASADFRDAVDAYRRGEHHGAAERLARFLARYPRDPRAEDAAYLRVIALRKAGNTQALKGAAEDYLRRYPAGFRHSEVEQLTR